MKQRDLALTFFGLGAFACLIVSLPATATAMELFHGYVWGIVATAVFEIGAVGSELTTLAIPQWRKRMLVLTIVLLLATTGANYALGVDAFVRASLPATYAAVNSAGYSWLLAVIAAGLFPALLFVFLVAFTARYRMLRGHYDTPMAVVAFWLSSAWQVVSRQLNDAEQRANLAEQLVSDAQARAEQSEQDREHLRQRALEQLNSYDKLAAKYEQEIAALRRELNARPPQLEVEIIEVARYRLTYEQLAQLSGASVSTVRRRLPELVGREAS